jgi:hypothetical protein
MDMVTTPKPSNSSLPTVKASSVVKLTVMALVLPNEMVASVSFWPPISSA